jgi:hypothetical protein
VNQEMTRLAFRGSRATHYGQFPLVLDQANQASCTASSIRFSVMSTTLHGTRRTDALCLLERRQETRILAWRNSSRVCSGGFSMFVVDRFTVAQNFFQSTLRYASRQ